MLSVIFDDDGKVICTYPDLDIQPGDHVTVRGVKYEVVSRNFEIGFAGSKDVLCELKTQRV